MKKNITTVTLENGFTCAIDMDKLDDWRFVEIMGSSGSDDRADAQMSIFVINNVLTPEESAALKKLCLKEDGKTVSATKMQDAIKEIFSQLAQAKNS